MKKLYYSSQNTPTYFIIIFMIIFMTGCTFAEKISKDNVNTDTIETESEIIDTHTQEETQSPEYSNAREEEITNYIEAFYQHTVLNLREDYTKATLTYVDNTEVGWNYYTDNPWYSDEVRDKLAQIAIMELYSLTGYNVEECVYTTDGRSKFIFGKSADAIGKSTAFYTRDFGDKLHNDATPYMGFVNARRVHYSDVQQLDSPYQNPDLNGDVEIATWILQHSGIYQSQEIIGSEEFNLDDTVFTHMKLYISGGYYIVVMDEKIESAHSVSGPYYTGPDTALLDTYFSDIEDEVYKNLLIDLLVSGVFPETAGREFSGQPYDNKYCIMDIDADGQDELLLNFANAGCMADMVFYIYDYNRTTGELYMQHSEFPALTIYDNGYIKADASHNHGKSNLDNFWPYSLYKYDSNTDLYEYVAFIDAWQAILYGEDFPKENDIDGDGIIYYTHSDIFDNAEYIQWCEPYLSGTPIKIQWLPIITEEEYNKAFPCTAIG